MILTYPSAQQRHLQDLQSSDCAGQSWDHYDPNLSLSPAAPSSGPPVFRLCGTELGSLGSYASSSRKSAKSRTFPDLTPRSGYHRPSSSSLFTNSAKSTSTFPSDLSRPSLSESKTSTVTFLLSPS